MVRRKFSHEISFEEPKVLILSSDQLNTSSSTKNVKKYVDLKKTSRIEVYNTKKYYSGCTLNRTTH